MGNVDSVLSHRSPGEGSGRSLQCSCLGNPVNRGAWSTAVYGIAKNWTRLCVQKAQHTHTSNQLSYMFQAFFLIKFVVIFGNVFKTVKMWPVLQKISMQNKRSTWLTWRCMSEQCENSAVANFRPQTYRPGFTCRRTLVGMFPVCSREDREQRVS